MNEDPYNYFKIDKRHQHFKLNVLTYLKQAVILKQMVEKK